MRLRHYRIIFMIIGLLFLINPHPSLAAEEPSLQQYQASGECENVIGTEYLDCAKRGMPYPECVRFLRCSLMCPLTLGDTTFTDEQVLACVQENGGQGIILPDPEPNPNPNPNPNPDPNPYDVEQVIQDLVNTATSPVAPIVGGLAGTLLAVVIAALRGAGTTPVKPPVRLPPSEQDGLRQPPEWVKDGLRRAPEPPEKLVTPSEQDGLRRTPNPPEKLTTPAVEDGLRQPPEWVKDGLRRAPEPLTVEQIMALPPQKVTFEQINSLSDADYERWEMRTFVKNLPAVKTYEWDGGVDLDLRERKKSEFLLGVKTSGALQDNKAVMLGDHVRADVDYATHEEFMGLGYSPEDGIKAGIQAEGAVVTEKVDGMLGNEDLGLTANAEVNVAKAQAFLGYRKGSAGAVLGFSLIEGEVATGANVAGVNVAVRGGLRLGIEFGLIIGKNIEVDFGPLKIAFSLGKAKTLSE